jgi:hypothetical protein
MDAIDMDQFQDGLPRSHLALPDDEPYSLDRPG